jgi:acyl-CoA hydrolase
VAQRRRREVNAKPGRRPSESRSTMAMVMMQQDANHMGNVFGGTIMKLVDLISYVTATRHCRTNTVTASIDKISFLSPVHVGDLLTLKANVNAAWTTSMEIGVRVEAEDMRTGEVRHTGSCYVTMVALGPDGKPARVPELTFETEEDHKRFRQANRRRARRLEEAAMERGDR